MGVMLLEARVRASIHSQTAFQTLSLIVFNVTIYKFDLTIIRIDGAIQ
jgi:hypothetical protein